MYEIFEPVATRQYPCSTWSPESPEKEKVDPENIEMGERVRNVQTSAQALQIQKVSQKQGIQTRVMKSSITWNTSLLRILNHNYLFLLLIQVYVFCPPSITKCCQIIMLIGHSLKLLIC